MDERSDYKVVAQGGFYGDRRVLCPDYCDRYMNLYMF